MMHLVPGAAVREFRYERKFLVDSLDASQARMLISRHPAMFFQPYPPRVVNNLYLDTIDLDNYFANVGGVGDRHKVRIRWYGDLFGAIAKPILEFKVKEGIVGAKFTFPFPGFRLDDDLTHVSFQHLVSDADLPPEVKRHLRTLTVVLCNNYKRWYYESHDRRYRVTVDDRLAYRRVMRCGNSFRERFLDVSHIVVELKYDRPLDVLAERVSAYFPFSVTRNSKYVTGIEAVYL